MMRNRDRVIIGLAGHSDSHARSIGVRHTEQFGWWSARGLRGVSHRGTNSGKRCVALQPPGNVRDQLYIKRRIALPALAIVDLSV